MPTRPPLLRPLALLALGVLALLAGCAAGTTGRSADVVVEGAWVRATTGAQDATMTGAFLSLRNTASGDVRLSGVSSTVAGRAELHRTAMDGGKAHMHRVLSGFRVPGGATTVLAPGGNHIMLLELRRPLRAGDEVTLVLTFSDGGTKTVIAPVKAYAEEKGAYGTPTSPTMHMAPGQTMTPGETMPAGTPTASP